jgi:hypothetical protein
MTPFSPDPDTTRALAEPKAHGILFKAPMVRALLNTKPGVWPAEPIDRAMPFKWQTRRIIKGLGIFIDTEMDMEPPESVDGIEWSFGDGTVAKCPHPPGTILWVKETWQPFFKDGAIYLADAGTSRINATSEEDAKAKWPKWKSSMLMPRWASRITLLVKSVRVERTQDISEADAIAEGFRSVGAFADLWVEINGRKSWNENPFVFVYETPRIK